MEKAEIGEINARFFEALERLIDKRRVLSMMGFCLDCGVDRGSIYRARREPSKHSIPVHLFGVIVERHGVSGDWLLTGRGSMWRDQPLPPPVADLDFN